jgi:hypothetical protein
LLFFKESETKKSAVLSSIGNNIQKNDREQSHCRQPRAATPRNGSTARGCVNASVFNHFLSINNIQLAFSQRVVEELEIFVVVRLDLYEWNSM